MTLNVAWQYVAGYFHSSLSAGVAAGATSIDVTPNASSGLVGLYPGMSLRIGQTTQTQETVVVKSVSGTTITLVDPIQNAYVVPSAPDFIAITTIPLVLVEAAIYVAAAILINSGQSAVVLSPSGSSGSSSLDDDVEAMLDQARYRIAPYQRILA
jgi:hypothetical protein